MPVSDLDPPDQTRHAAAMRTRVECILRNVRRQLHMDVAYLSRFAGHRAVFRAVDAPGCDQVKAGDSIDISEAYCPHILSGDLPQLIPDTGAHGICRELPITRQVPIGSHAAVPLFNEDGTVFGMFCCLARKPNPNLSAAALYCLERNAHFAADVLFDRQDPAETAAPVFIHHGWVGTAR